MNLPILLLSVMFTAAAAFAQALDWRLVSPYPTTARLNGIAFGNGTFVAVGDGEVLYSEDSGISWNKASGIANEPYSAIAYGNGRFVAITPGPWVITSTDGKTWTRTSVAGNPGLTDITFGNGVFAAIGNNGKVGSSSNAVDWTFATVGLRPDGGWIEFGNGQFIAVERPWQNGFVSMIRSTDGVQWTPYFPALPRVDFGYWMAADSLMFTQGKFFMVATRSFQMMRSLLSSADGAAFTTASSSIGFGELLSVNNYFLRLPPYSPEFSADVVNWAAIPAAEAISGAAFGNGVYILVGGWGHILRGPSLNSTTRVDSTEKSSRLAGVAATGNTVVAVDNYHPGRILFSRDGGRTFAIATTPSGLGAFYSVTYADGWFVAAGQNGAILRSADGAAWQQRLSNTSSSLHKIIRAAGLWVAVGANGKIITSPDSSVFSLRSSGTEVAINDVTHGAGKFIAVGSSGLILSSANGTDWNMDATDEARDLFGIAFGNGRFVATGAGGTIHTWIDGSPRQTTTIAGSDALRVVFHNGLFVAMNTGTSQVFVSGDGRAWTPSHAPSGSVYGIDVSAGRLWLAGYGDPFVAGSLIWEGSIRQLRLGATLVDGTMRLRISAPTPANYRILRVNSLSDAWTLRETVAVNGELDWTDPAPPASSAFYIVERQP